MSGNIVYYLCYDTPLGERQDGTIIRRIGKQTLERSEFDLDAYTFVCDYMIESYGPGTHWVEDEDGEKVYPIP